MFNAMRMLRCSRGIPKETVIRDELALPLEEAYAGDTPISEWSDDSPYVGHITKKLYIEHESNPIL